MQATLHKKSGGMHHVKKSGGMKHMKKTGGMATTKKTGGMKKIGGMNMTKKSGGKCGMPLETSGGMQHVKKSGGMHHKTVKGGMYHSKKHGGSRKLIKGGAQTQIEVDGKFYEITTTKDSVTVKAMEPESFEATKVPVLDENGFPLPPPPTTTTTTTGTTEVVAANDGGPLKVEELNTNIKDPSLNVNTLIENEDQEVNKDQKGNKPLLGSQEGSKVSKMTDNYEEEEEEKEEEEEEGGEEDMFKEVGPFEIAAENLIDENSSVWNKDMQDMLDKLNEKGDDEQTDDDKAAIKLLEEQKEGYEQDGGKKKGGKTLKKGGKPVKKHGGSVKKAFNKLFKRGGNKALPKKGGKK